MKISVTQNKWLVVLLFLCLFSACDDRFSEINTSPNDITDIPNEYLFANAVRQTFLSNLYIQFKFGGQYAHIYVGNNDARYVDSYFDSFSNAEYRYVFDHIYLGAIRNINQVIEFTRVGGAQENELQNAMAKVVSYVSFLRLADGYGSIPFHQGGAGQKEVLYPKYDSVETIYTDIINQLQSCVSVLQNGEAKNGYPESDPLFNNDLSKWLRFANSLRLRLAMRIRFVAPQLAVKVVAECMDYPLMEENGDNVGIECQDSDISELQNPLYSAYNEWKWKMGKLFVDQLQSTGDPRLQVFVQPNAAGEYVGIPNGLTDSYFSEWNWTATSNPSANLVGKGAPIYYMSAAEIWLLRAEAALHGMVEGDANELYRKGIRRSLEQWEVPEEEINGFLQSPSCTLWGNEAQQFEQISTQLWIAYMPDTFEAWCNIRRSGYPKISQRMAPVYETGASNGWLPKRLCYPAIEANINRVNYLKALEQQGVDKITTPLWWDVRD